EPRFDRRAELHGDGLDHLFEGGRRDLVEQLVQLVDDVTRNDVEPQREVLTELDVRHAELLEREADPRATAQAAAPHAEGTSKACQQAEPDQRPDERDAPAEAEQAAQRLLAAVTAVSRAPAGCCAPLPPRIAQRG